MSSPHNHPITTLAAPRPDTLGQTLANDRASHSLNLSLTSSHPMKDVSLGGREGGRH